MHIRIVLLICICVIAQTAAEASEATCHFRPDSKEMDGQKASSTSYINKQFGLTGGIFSIDVPKGWDIQEDDGSDPKSFLMRFDKYDSTSGTCSIYIEFYADGNRDFNDYADFVKRNTTSLLKDVPPIEVNKVTIRDNNALWFERTKKVFLHPESKSDERVTLKEKFYVLLAKDRKGFFVLSYSSPESTFSMQLPTFESMVGSFTLR